MKIKTIELDDFETGILMGGLIIGIMTFVAGLIIGKYVR